MEQLHLVEQVFQHYGNVPLSTHEVSTLSGISIETVTDVIDKNPKDFLHTQSGTHVPLFCLA